jgi:hypothetical protein
MYVARRRTKATIRQQNKTKKCKRILFGHNIITMAGTPPRPIPPPLFAGVSPGNESSVKNGMVCLV